MAFEPASDIGNLPIVENGGSGGGGGSSITIGTTVIPLGGTALILDGLTSVTSALFVGNLLGSSSSTQSLVLSSDSSNQNQYVTFSSTGSGASNLSTNPGFRFNPSTGTLSATNFSGNGSQLTNIPNSALLNSSLIIGSTVLSLGSTTTILTGLTSITSALFIGNLTGTADKADLIKITQNTDNQFYRITFVNHLSPYSSLMYNTLTYVPASNTLAAGFFSGNGSLLTNIPNTALTNSSITIGTTNIALGNASLVLAGLTSVTSAVFIGDLTGTADSADSLNLTISTSNTNYYLPFSLGQTGYNTLFTGSIRYNPSTNVLTSGTFSGSGALLTNIPNGALTNSSITIGSTLISLGATVTTLAGLSSVTSTNFVGNLTGNASSSTTIQLTVTTSNSDYYPTFALSPSGNVGLFSGSLRYNPSTNILTSGSFSGSGALLTGIPNSALINSSITIGSTSISLGTTVLTITGLTSITSTDFIGHLQGTADIASTLTLTTNLTSANFYVPFSALQTGNNALFTNTLLYNPGTDTLTVGNLVANIVGAVTNINVTNDLANTNYSVVFSSVNSGSAQLFTDVSGFTYNPSLNTLSAVTFVGNLTGTASNITVANNTTSAAYSVLFSSVNTGSGSAYTDTAGFTYNPSTNVLVVNTVQAALTGTATNATNVNVVTTSTNATHFVTFTAASTGNTPVRALAAFTFNPSTQILTVANIVTTTGYNITNTTTTGAYPLLFSSTATGSNLIRAGGNITYNPATDVLVAGSFSGSGALLTGIPNSALTNSSVTIGTTVLSLGQTSTTLAGLTSVTSTTFVGNLTGTADVSNSLTLTTSTTNASFLLTFATASGTQNLFVGTLSYNPSTNILTSGTFSGSGALLTNIPNAALTNSSVTIGTTTLSLGATSLTLAGLTSVTSTSFIGALTGNASSATLINLTDVSLNTNYNVVFTDATVAGNSTVSKSANNNLLFNPNVGFLTATRFVGSGAGLTNIPNAALTNSSVTIGTTNISLGATSLTLAGLTSVTSTTFIGALTGNASSATLINLTSTITNANFNLLFSNSTTGNSSVSASGNNNLLFNPSTGILTATQFSGSGAGLTSIPNSALTNSSITIGTTSISLGATALSLAGLTSVSATTFNGSGAGLTSIPNSGLVNSSITLGTTTVSLGGTVTNISGLNTVTATNFVGNFSGTVTDAQNLQVTLNSLNQTFYLPFVANATTSVQAFYINSGISLNPSTSTITATNFSGTATNSVNAGITAVASNANFYVTFSAAKTGNNPLQSANGDNLLFNPSTGVLTAGQFSGSGAGLTSIPNAALTNSSITIGTTSISLGATATTLAGLTSVSATAFNGSGAGLTNIPNTALTNSSITIGTTSISLGATSTTLAGLTSVTSALFTGSGAGLTSIPNSGLVNSSITIGTTSISLGATATTLAGLTSVSATTFNGSGAGLTNIPNAALTNSSITIGTTSISLGASSTTLAGLTSVTSTLFTGSGAGLTSIPNSGLVNSSITIGSTSISLGATVTTLSGLTSVTATTFNGNLNGTANSASNITINSPIFSADISYSTIVTTNSGTGIPVYVTSNNDSYKYNPLLSRNYIGNFSFPAANYFQNTTVNRLNFTNLPTLVRTNQPLTSMVAIACNSTGRVVAVANSTTIAISNDYGSLFGSSIAIPGVTVIAMCDAGQYIVTNNTDNTNISIRLSTNYGTSFSQIVVAAVASTPVTGVSISGNCKYILVNTATTTQYLSTNYGTSFTTISYGTAGQATNSHISADGKFMVLTNVSGSASTYSQDYGVSFTPASAGLTGGLNNSVISDDGKYSYTVTGTQIGRTTNLGSTFTLTAFGTTVSYARVKCSTDGRIVILSLGSTLNQTRYSQDFGASYTNISNSSITGLAMTDNGQYFYLIDSGNMYQYGNAVTTVSYGSTDIAGVLSVNGDAVFSNTSIFNGPTLLNSDTYSVAKIFASTIDAFNGSTIGFNNRSLISIGTDTGGSQILCGTNVGGGLSTATPFSIDLGRSFSSSAGANPKLILVNDGTNKSGLGIALGELFIANSVATDSLRYYSGGVQRLSINNTVATISVGITNTIGGTNVLSTDSTGAIVFSGTTSANTALYIANNANPTISTGATMVLQSVFSPNGFMALNFNGIYNGTETRFNTSKTRWRVYANQNASADTFGIDNYNGTSIIQYVNVTRSTANTVTADYPTAYNTNFFAAPRAYIDQYSATINQNAVNNTANFSSTGTSSGSLSLPANIIGEAVGRGFELYFTLGANFAVAGANVSFQIFINSSANGLATIYTFSTANAVMTFRVRFTKNTATVGSANFRYTVEVVSSNTGRLLSSTSTFTSTASLTTSQAIGFLMTNNAAVAASTVVSVACLTLTCF